MITTRRLYPAEIFFADARAKIQSGYLLGRGIQMTFVIEILRLNSRFKDDDRVKAMLRLDRATETMITPNLRAKHMIKNRHQGFGDKKLAARCVVKLREKDNPITNERRARYWALYIYLRRLIGKPRSEDPHRYRSHTPITITTCSDRHFYVLISWAVSLFHTSRKREPKMRDVFRD